MGTAAAKCPATRVTAELGQRFEAIVFDWDGTAVRDRSEDAGRLRGLVESACAWGLHLAIVSGTHLANVDGQLRARPAGPGTLHLLLNRGAEVYRVGVDGPALVERRRVGAAERARLVAAAELTVRRLAALGLADVVLIHRPNRVKIDLIPLEEWRDPPKARLAELLGAVEARLHERGITGLRAVLDLAHGCAAASGIRDPRVTTDAKHVELGVSDKSDSARWCFGRLQRLGVGGGLVLVAGDEFGALGGAPGSDSMLLVPEAQRATAVTVGVEPGGPPPGVLHLGGGPPAFLALLEDQVDRRRRGEPPAVDDDPAWSVAIEGLDPRSERAHESCLTLADGRIGTRGSVVLEGTPGSPGVFAAGVYRGAGATSELLPAPLWNRIARPLAPGEPVRRVLDLRAGLLRQEVGAGPRRLEAVMLSSAAHPGTAALRARSNDVTIDWGAPLRLPRRDGTADRGSWARVDGDPGGVAVAATQREIAEASEVRLERLAVYRTDPRRRPTLASAQKVLRCAEARGFEALLNQHRERMGARWEQAGIDIGGDPELERDVRFALFHLIGSAAGRSDAAVGARGLTGPAYRGHVFWDADVFVLPFLAATWPAAARAMLAYRVRRLAAAQDEARREGSQGAHFPWESASTGEEVTPSRGRDRLGRFVAIRTGSLEDHIVADIAWAASCYAEWTGDEAFLRGPARGLMLETARWWADRIELDADGRAHIRGVMGPDEYHLPVDDNAFTNVMARWNLRRAAALAAASPGAGVADEELARWHRLADALVDGYDPATGLYEQFAGFHRLEPLLIADIAPRRPIAATLLLGEQRVASAQIVKQADVLMLHHLLPDEVEAGSLVPNLDYYEPRTAHGSSLSPGVHAALLARADRLEAARELLRLTARIDLDDVTETTSGGIHLAAMGSVWQAVALGFAGLRPSGDTLLVDPRIPEAWDSLTVRIRFRGARLLIAATHEAVTVKADRPARVRVSDQEPLTVTTRAARVPLAPKGDRR